MSFLCVQGECLGKSQRCLGTSLKILMALEWLKQNNRDISLDQLALAQLPEDGNVSGLSTIVLPLDADDSTSLDDDTFMSGTFVPMVQRKQTKQNVIRESISSRQHTDENMSVLCPHVSNTPIKTEGYMKRAFPTLFPTGEAAPCVHHW